MAEVQGQHEVKRNWWELRRYEVFYPNVFSPVFPWIEEGTNQHAKHPRFPWKVNEFPQHFPDRFRHEFAQRFILDNARILGCDGTLERLSIPIKHLSHCTHEGPKIAITTAEAGKCIFKPRAKRGRTNGTTYAYVLNNEDQQLPERCAGKVLPGYLSWWGISVKDWYDNDPKGVEKKIAIQHLKQGDGDISYVHVPTYLQDEPCSGYGEWSFTYDINTLIENYKECRDDCEYEDEMKVHFKKAGTLRYTHEICYVILVCMSKDLRKNSSIRLMPTAKKVDEPNLDSPTYFQIDGSDAGIDSFNSEYPIRCIHSKNYYSWDQLVFAFYFPNERQRLICDHIEPEPVKHGESYCHLKPCPSAA